MLAKVFSYYSRKSFSREIATCLLAFWAWVVYTAIQPDAGPQQIQVLSIATLPIFTYAGLAFGFKAVDRSNMMAGK